MLPPARYQVVVVDINMKFWSMVNFMVKWVLASIPAFLILVLIFAAVLTFLGVLGITLADMTPVNTR